MKREQKTGLLFFLMEMPMLVEQAGLFKVQAGTYPDLAVAGRSLDRIKRSAEVLPTIVAIGD